MTKKEDPKTKDKQEASAETIEFIYQHTKEGPNLQFRDSDQLDTKITAVFAAATLAIGFAARLPKTEGPQISYLIASQSGYINLVDMFFYFAVVAWGVVAVMTLLHVWTKAHRRAIRADILWTPKYRYESLDKLKRRALVDIREAYIHNQGVLKRKAKIFNRALSGVAAEGVFLVLALTLARSVS